MPISTSNPSSLHKSIKKARSNTSTEIRNLSVGKKLYTSPNIPDGFYDSLSTLKTQDYSDDSPQFQRLLADSDNVIKLCIQGPNIPSISLEKSSRILYNIRPSVNDLYSITASHYINAGVEGLHHFNFLMNTLISDINLIPLPEVNSVYACILYKGHNKDKSSDRSYRTR